MRVCREELKRFTLETSFLPRRPREGVCIRAGDTSTGQESWYWWGWLQDLEDTKIWGCSRPLCEMAFYLHITAILPSHL